jgi:hypothetical protein
VRRRRRTRRRCRWRGGPTIGGPGRSAWWFSGRHGWPLLAPRGAGPRRHLAQVMKERRSLWGEIRWVTPARRASHLTLRSGLEPCLSNSGLSGSGRGVRPCCRGREYRVLGWCRSGAVVAGRGALGADLHPRIGRVVECGRPALPAVVDPADGSADDLWARARSSSGSWMRSTPLLSLAAMSLFVFALCPRTACPVRRGELAKDQPRQPSSAALGNLRDLGLVTPTVSLSPAPYPTATPAAATPTFPKCSFPAVDTPTFGC